MRFSQLNGYRTGPPFISFGLTSLQITLIQIVALAPPVIVTIASSGTTALQIAAVAVVVTLFWELLFAILRRKSLTWHGLTTAMIMIVMVPTVVPLWQLAMAVSFGVVLTELIFGGRGFGFLNAAVTSLAFLVFSFPGSALSGAAIPIAMSSLPGALLLLLFGLISLRVVLAAVTAIAVFSIANPEAFDPIITLSAAAFGLIFLVCDPISSASTNPGRIAYGLFVGLLTAFFDSHTGPAISPVAVVFAALLGSIFAPLIDHVVVLFHAVWRRRRNG